MTDLLFIYVDPDGQSHSIRVTTTHLGKARDYRTAKVEAVDVLTGKRLDRIPICDLIPFQEQPAIDPVALAR